MPDTTISLTEVIMGVGLTLWGMVAWFGRRLVGRVDIHTEEMSKKVDRDEHNGSINALRKEMSTQTERIFDKIDESNTAVNTRIETLTEAVYTRRRGE